MTKPRRQKAFALIELPLVLGILAVVGIIIGALLWRHNGALTAGAWLSFSMTLPLCIFLTLAIVFIWRDKKRSTK